MLSMQNMDACVFFADEIMPTLPAELNATFRVVGKIRDADAEKLRSFPNVQVVGQVDSIADAVADARVGVCPVRLGAGIQNKILEYMALGLPVITSIVGLEGIDAQENTELLVARKNNDYAEHLQRIWSDQGYAEKLALSARLYVENQHDWHTCLTPIIDAVASHFDQEQ
jgi:glycosyltransferase involved in cell wall biosynthesis